MAGQNSNTKLTKKPHNPKSHAPAVYIPCWLIQVPSSKLSYHAKLIYGRLSQWSTTKGTVTRSIPQLSAELGMNKNTIERGLKELREVELIATYQKLSGGQNYYVFYEHEWMHESLTEALEVYEDKYLDSTPHQKCGDPTSDVMVPPIRSDAPKVKESKINKITTSVSNETPVIAQEIIDAYHEILPEMPKCLFITQDLNSAIKKLIIAWPELTGNKFNIAGIRGYFTGIKETASFFTQPYITKNGNKRRSNLLNLIRIDTIKKFANGVYSA